MLGVKLLAVRLLMCFFHKSYTAPNNPAQVMAKRNSVSILSDPMIGSDDNISANTFATWYSKLDMLTRAVMCLPCECVGVLDT